MRIPVDHDLVEAVETLGPALNGVRPKLSIPYLSGSQISTFARCGQAYDYRYNDKKPESPAVPLLMGSAIHDAYENILEDIDAGPGIQDLRRQAAITRSLDDDLKKWDAYACAQNDIALGFEANTANRWIKGPAHTRETLYSDAITAAETLAKHVERNAAQGIRPAPAPGNVNTTPSERGYIIHWRDKNVLPLLCYVDAIFRRPNDRGSALDLNDLKTGMREKSFKDLSYAFVMAAYAFAVSVEYDEQVETISYTSLTFKSPGKSAETPIIAITDVVAPYEPSRIKRVHEYAKRLSTFKRLETFTLCNDVTICASCAYSRDCENDFGRIGLIAS